MCSTHRANSFSPNFFLSKQILSPENFNFVGPNKRLRRIAGVSFTFFEFGSFAEKSLSRFILIRLYSTKRTHFEATSTAYPPLAYRVHGRAGTARPGGVL
jgi:hypothetical protein